MDTRFSAKGAIPRGRKCEKSGRKREANTPPIVWRGFSGHWMLFYSAALATLYSAAKASGDVQRCLNRYAAAATANFYSRCSQSVVNS